MTATLRIEEFACHDASCAPPPAGTGGSRKQGSSADIDTLFKGKVQIVTPFPTAGRKKGTSKIPSPAAIAEALRNPKLVDVDPKDVKTQQTFVTRDGVAYYLQPKYKQTGETYADPGDLGNRFPIVWKRKNGDQVIISGNHRFTAALIEGRKQKAIVIEE